MNVQRRHETKGDLQLPAKLSHKARLPPTLYDSERYHNRMPGGHQESADEGHNSRRDEEGEYPRSGRSSRADGLVAGSYYNNGRMPSSKTAVSTGRPPSRSAVARPPHPTIVQSSQPQLQPRPQSQRLKQDMPESYDLRSYPNKRPPAPSPKPSYEQVSSFEDGAKPSRHLRSRSRIGTTVPMPAVFINPGQEQSTSAQRSAEKDRRREGDSERPEKYVEQERMKVGNSLRENELIGSKSGKKAESSLHGKEKRVKTKEEISLREKEQSGTKERINERDKYAEGDSERWRQGDFESRFKSTSLSKDFRAHDHRIEDPDDSDGGRRPVGVASRHRRHRTEEGTQSTSAVR
jgi:hypothetical protein